MPKLSDLLWDYIPDKQAFQGMGNDLLAAANRGGVAGVLGAPVDIANQLANLGRALYGYAWNKAGLLSADQMPQLDERPIGGSEWIGQQMQDAGLINGNRNALAELLAGMVMPGAMLKGGVKANQAMDAAIANAQRPRTLNTPGYKGQRGATVWHGSPHDIQPKPGGKYPEFDMSKIGTGEGAQAYGHGLYAAEDQGVGRSYMKAGVLDNFSSTPERATEAIYNALGPWADGRVSFGPLRSRITKEQLLEKVKNSASDVYMSLSPAQQKAADAYGQTAGNLYKVDIPDEAIPRMLDWDKPLSQQSPEVQRALSNTKNKQLRAMIDYANVPYSEMAGGEAKTMGEAFRLLNLNLQGKSSADSAKASALLAKQGIPGIRYLDGGSRSAGTGTSNYVLFDDKLGRILEKNGVPTGQTPWTPEEWAAYLSGGGK